MPAPAYRRPEKVLVFLYRRPSGPAQGGAQEALEYLLLQRRPERTHSGAIWQTVVGNLHWEEDRVDAVRREVLQETGLTTLRGITAVGYTFTYPLRLRENQESWYAPDVTAIRNTVYAAEVIGDGPVLLCPEHIHYRWCPYAEAWKRLYWPEEREALSHLHRWLAAERLPG